MATATASSDIQFSGLTKCLIREGLLAEEDAQKHIDQAKKNKVPLLKYLVTQKIVDSKQVANFASIEFGVPFLDLSAIDLKAIPLTAISEKLVRQHHILPLFKRGNKLFIALSDPTNLQALEEIKFNTRAKIETILVEEDKLAKAIDTAIEEADTTMSDLLDEDLENLEISDGTVPAAGDDVETEIDDAPLVRFVNKVLLDAIKRGVSDIHIEPYEKFLRIRYRSDGLLHEIANPPQNMANRIISRIKVMARMDIAERRVPQDGRIKMNLSKTRAIDFRVNTCPTLFGEKIVLRILDPTTAQIGIEQLGFEPVQQEMFMEAIAKPYGMILVTGPTGSGKTVTLYTALNILNDPKVNISTAEDPVEITVAGINQVTMNPKAGLNFADTLRAFLRQDPDIIMVGEIRDLETAEISVKAAQTGHLVLSTLHTNDAPQTLNRLVQMGIPPFNIVASVLLIMAQRLARKLCEHCKQKQALPDQALMEFGFKKNELDGLIIYSHGPGCKHCTEGYKGRVGIFQVMPISEEMRTLILNGGDTLQLANLASKEGIKDMRESGREKIRQGVTSIEEIDRITRE
jgi:type IV pilus assembly protein PilB